MATLEYPVCLFLIRGASGLVEIACVASPHRRERDWGGTTTPGAGLAAAVLHPRQKGSQQRRLPDGPPRANLGLEPGSPHHHSMASSPSSSAFLRLREFIAERMRMTPIEQPLML